MKVYVLWWRYLGEPGSGISRVFADKQLAVSTLELLEEDPKEWELSEMKITGPIHGLTLFGQLLNNEETTEGGE